MACVQLDMVVAVAFTLWDLVAFGGEEHAK